MSLMSAAEASPDAADGIEFPMPVPIAAPAPRADRAWRYADELPAAGRGRRYLGVTEPAERALSITEVYYRELQVRRVRVATSARQPGTPLASPPVSRASAARSRGSAARPAPLRLTRRGRTVVTVLALLAACAAAAVLWLSMAGGAQASSQGQPAGAGFGGMTRVVVRPGQTLWSIASAAEPTANTQTVVQQIIDANALSGASIDAGQLLWVPQA